MDLLQAVSEVLTPFIAALAIGLTVWQVHVTRKHNRLSCLPEIVLDKRMHRDGKQMTLSYFICNYGIGPAKIKEMKLFLDKELFDNGEPAKNIIKKALATSVNYEVTYASRLNPKYTIPEKGEYLLARIVVERWIDRYDEYINFHLIDVCVHIEYASFYDEEKIFISRLGETRE